MLYVPPPAPTDPDEDLYAPIRVELGEKKIGNFPEIVTIEGCERRYVTHFTGKLDRAKSFVITTLPTYELAAYCEKPHHGKTETLLDGMLVDGSPRLLMLRFKNALPGRAILSDIYGEIQASFGDVDFPRLKPNIDRFVQQFGRGSRKGEVVYLVWLPGGRVYSGFGTPERLQLISEDEALARAIWRIWCGPQSGPERVHLVERFADDATMKR
jgi:hypothetical protein